jgi:hypothetical protein
VPLLDPQPLALESWDPLVRARLRSGSGKLIAYVYPGRDIWQERTLAEFSDLTRSVDPRVTGVPEQVYQSTRIMERGFRLAVLYSLVVVAALVWLDFRSILWTALALAPILFGVAAGTAAMSLFGLAFNLANFFGVPIVIGTGINAGVHFIHRYREQRSPEVLASSAGASVVLSEATTALGFATLMLAHHRGLWSLGALMALFCGACLLGSIVVVPAVLRLAHERTGRARLEVR